MSISGHHAQAGTGRKLRYWATFEGFNGRAVYSAAVFEADRYLASVDGDFAYDARSLSAEDAVRLHLKQYMDRAHFGEGEGPPPGWGWSRDRPGLRL